MQVSRFKVATLAVAAVALAACSKKDSGTTDTTAASSTMSADTSAMAASSTNAGGSWSDANILALLDEANAADSSEGAIAATKGTSAAVRNFGKQMMTDHHKMRVQGQALAKKLNLTPTPPADDNITSDAQKETDNLNSTAKGKDFDKAYIDGQVDDHKKVLDLAVKAMGQAQSTELKNLIQKATPTVQSHLDKAQSIQKTLK
ncbi:MAG: putative rane protein [Gemmatimonadaceae bacterium]|jgi:putative membrane protein|nr:putative rane protein [Gemmatimonadaceae bacterium]